MVADQSSDTDKHSMADSVVENLICLVSLAIILFLANAYSIYTRPLGSLGLIEPANAILLGLLVSHPRFANIYGYIGAIIGYFAAYRLEGVAFTPSVMVIATKLSGVCVGHFLLCCLSEDHRKLRRPQSVFLLFLIVTAASATAGVLAGVANPILQNTDPFAGWLYWFASEMANYMLVLPIMLYMPGMPWARIVTFLKSERRRTDGFVRIETFFPLLAFAASSVVALFIGGHGSIAFPIPALLWCAITYNQWITAVLMLFYAMWMLASGTTMIEAMPGELQPQTSLLSLRLGIAFAVIGPQLIVSLMAIRRELTRRLDGLASHDQLTGLLNERAFNITAGQRVTDLHAVGAPVTLLMLDLDHFKQINDVYGHTAGDQVLAHFAEVLTKSQRDTEVIGRIGGEEFAVVIPECSQSIATSIAERIRNSFAKAIVQTASGMTIRATVSIGMVHSEVAPTDIAPYDGDC